MRPEIGAALVEAVRQVFSDTGIVIHHAQPGMPEGAQAQVIASVGLTGYVRGILMLSTDRAGAAAIVRGLAHGLHVPELGPGMSELELGAIGEISNQVAGRTITLLSTLGLHCDITPPAVVAAVQLQSLVPDVAESFQQTFFGPFGRLSVWLGVQRIDSGVSHPKN